MNLKNLTKNIPYQWRVQSFQPSTAVCVAYIDSRDVQIILDEEIGPENWQCDYKEIKGNLFCGLGIRIGDQWVWKWDCGTESNTEKEKGEASDSFKRAAVKWGIGRFLYDLDIVRIKWVEKDKKKYPANAKGEPIYDKGILTAYINSLQTKGKGGDTSHNHNSNLQEGKPLISNKQFKQLIERIEKGDHEAGKKAKETFSFESAQLKILNDKIPAIV